YPETDTTQDGEYLWGLRLFHQLERATVGQAAIDPQRVHCRRHLRVERRAMSSIVDKQVVQAWTNKVVCAPPGCQPSVLVFGHGAEGVGAGVPCQACGRPWFHR